MGDMSEKLNLVITGAGGFIGRQTVAVARARGHAVRAVVRKQASVPRDWQTDPMIEVVISDLAGDGAIEHLEAALDRTDAVIHAAAAMAGDDVQQTRDTVCALEAVIATIVRQPRPRPRLVLVSSITVYDALAMVPFAMLDETSPIESTPQSRDAYCRSKLQQEKLAVEAARKHDLFVRIMRPGAVFGPGRIWNGHLGPRLGPVVLLVETRGEIPVSFIAHCAEALVLAAEVPITKDDYEVSDAPSDAPNLAPSGAAGCVEVINVIDDDRPTRAGYMASLQRPGQRTFVLGGIQWLLSKAATALNALGLSRRLPGLLRPAILAARMKPLTYSNARLRERLGWQPSSSFNEAMTTSLTQPADWSVERHDRPD